MKNSLRFIQLYMITRNDIDILGFKSYLDEIPYNTTMSGLYTPDMLYDKFLPGISQTLEDCYDIKVYRHFLNTGKVAEDNMESMARSLHDHFIRDGINELLSGYPHKAVVGVMGGSAMKRNEESYLKVSIISKKLTEQGSLMVSGGGSGAMEATCLGALMAGRSMDELRDAVSILSQSPTYTDKGYLDRSFEVLARYPHHRKYRSLTIPTWLYGHEPTTPFATDIAKMFENSVREDLLLTVAYGGLIFAPGSAGTIQEIFQEAVQNHYVTLGLSSPMIFLDRKFWTEDIPAYTMLKELSDNGQYHNLILGISDNPDEIVQMIDKFQNG